MDVSETMTRFVVSAVRTAQLGEIAKILACHAIGGPVPATNGAGGPDARSPGRYFKCRSHMANMSAQVCSAARVS